MLEIAGITYRGTSFLSPDDLALAVQTDLERTVGRMMEGLAEQTILTLHRVSDQLEKRHGGSWPLSGGTFGTAPDRLSRRSGKGIESIRKTIKGYVDPVKVERAFAWGSISTGSLTVHETGATVAPKRSRYLAIPLRAALTSQGLPLRSGPRAWPDTFFMRTKNGNLMIAQRTGKDSFRPLYLLARKAVIPPRLRMEETLNANLSYFKSKALAEVEKAIRA